MIQSLEYFTKIKMTRGDAGSQMEDKIRSIDYFNHFDNPCLIKDTLLADMVVRSGPKNLNKPISGKSATF